MTRLFSKTVQKLCGGGEHLVQRRRIKEKPTCGGKACQYYYTAPSRRRRVSCNTQCCPAKCLRKWSSKQIPNEHNVF